LQGSCKRPFHIERKRPGALVRTGRFGDELKRITDAGEGDEASQLVEAVVAAAQYLKGQV
jgi:hypothetical protein